MERHVNCWGGMTRALISILLTEYNQSMTQGTFENQRCIRSDVAKVVGVVANYNQYQQIRDW